jgi:predicted CoA-binding protein
MNSTPQTVLILGASDNPARYSYMAMKMLQQSGHQVVLVSPRVKQIEGIAVYSSLGEVPCPVDTVTMYVGPEISTKAASALQALNPKRVIFNPGAENPGLAKLLEAGGVAVLEACTLVLLRTGQF